jgi:hypothetical protein
VGVSAPEAVEGIDFLILGSRVRITPGGKRYGDRVSPSTGRESAEEHLYNDRKCQRIRREGRRQSVGCAGIKTNKNTVSPRCAPPNLIRIVRSGGWRRLADSAQAATVFIRDRRISTPRVAALGAAVTACDHGHSRLAGEAVRCLRTHLGPTGRNFGRSELVDAWQVDSGAPALVVSPR